METQNVQDLQQRINKKFIRNVIKPRQYLSHIEEQMPYRIPNSSELLKDKPFEPETYFTPYRHGPILQQQPFQQTHALREPFETLSSPTPPPSPSPPTPPPSPSPPSPPVVPCVFICEHVRSCPVCNQIYRPQTGIYLTVIVILVIVILFLLKKIFQF